MTEPLYRAIVEGFKGIIAVLGMKLDIVGEETSLCRVGRCSR